MSPKWARYCQMERVMGIEPTLFAWEAKVLPLNYTRVPQIVIAARDAGWRSGGNLQIPIFQKPPSAHVAP